MTARRYLSNALAIVFTVVLAGGCGSSPAAPEDGDPLAVTRLRAEPFSFSTQSGFTEPARIVVRTREQWLAAWTIIVPATPLSLPPPLPEIDFEREMLIVAAMGTRSTGGFDIIVESATESPRGLVTVQIRSLSPCGGSGVTQAVTKPVDIARLPRRNGPVAYAEKLETRPCAP
jgi:hypothetical protein